MSERYSFSLTTFAPSGKLVQIEYALNAVAQGGTSVGIKARQGVVLCTERKPSTLLMDESSLEKVTLLCDQVGVVYSGMGPDARVLIARARKAAQAYKLTYGCYPPTEQLVKEVAKIMQEFTQSGGVRPFGVSLLVAGVDEDEGPALFQVDPSGSYFAWKASAIGKNYLNAKSFLEKRYHEQIELEDAVHTAILTLKEGFEGQLTAQHLEIGVVGKEGKFRRLEVSEIQDYLANII